MSLDGVGAAKSGARAMLAQAYEEISEAKAGVAVLTAARRYNARSGKVAVDGRDELCHELSKVAADQGAEVVSLVAELEHGVDLGDKGGVGFKKAFRGRMNLDAAARQVEKSVLTNFVVERVVAAGGHQAIEVLEVEDVRSGLVAAFCGGDDAFEEKRVCDTDDEGARGTAVDANALEIGLHGHVWFDDACIGDGADEVDERRDGFAGYLGRFGNHNDAFAENELLHEDVEVGDARHIVHERVP